MIEIGLQDYGLIKQRQQNLLMILQDQLKINSILMSWSILMIQMIPKVHSIVFMIFTILQTYWSLCHCYLGLDKEVCNDLKG